MSALVLYAVGSPLAVDYAESAFRAGVTVTAGIRNFAGPCYINDAIPILDLEACDADLRPLPYLVPLFTPRNRATAQREAEARGFATPGRLVDPTAILPRRFELGAGGYVNAGCVVGSHCSIGRFGLINRSASIGHHVTLGDFVSLGPRATLAGNIAIGDGVTIGAGAIVLPSVKIGAHAVVGGGSVVTRDVPANSLVLGNPAKIVRDDLPSFMDEAR